MRPSRSRCDPPDPLLVKHVGDVESGRVSLDVAGDLPAPFAGHHDVDGLTRAVVATVRGTVTTERGDRTAVGGRIRHGRHPPVNGQVRLDARSDGTRRARDDGRRGLRLRFGLQLRQEQGVDSAGPFVDHRLSPAAPGSGGGRRSALAKLDLAGTYTHVAHGATPDDDHAEWIPPVRWLQERPLAGAYWETGSFANQNSAGKLRQSFTIDRLGVHFD